MANQRDKNKKQVSFWATDEEKALLLEAASRAGFESLADYLRWIAAEQPRPGQMPKPPKEEKKE